MRIWLLLLKIKAEIPVWNQHVGKKSQKTGCCEVAGKLLCITKDQAVVSTWELQPNWQRNERK